MYACSNISSSFSTFSLSKEKAFRKKRWVKLGGEGGIDEEIEKKAEGGGRCTFLIFHLHGLTFPFLLLISPRESFQEKQG